ncbi:MAG: YggT family protein [Firmicutes bacterium]|nr:YggT family protein [Bacillota bacterium]
MTLVIGAVNWFSYILTFMLLIRVVLSWFAPNPRGPLIRAVYAMTEPILGPIRRLLRRSPFGGGGGFPIDFSPLIAYFVILLAKEIIIGVLRLF